MTPRGRRSPTGRPDAAGRHGAITVTTRDRGPAGMIVWSIYRVHADIGEHPP
jgi:hypothetical protein